MRKGILFIIGLLFISSFSYSMPEDPDKVIILKGGYGIDTNSVQVTIDKNQTITTTFYKDIDDVTVTIKKRSGEIISVESMDAKEWDSCPTNIPDYKEGEYKIEISTPNGELEGNF